MAVIGCVLSGSVKTQTTTDRPLLPGTVSGKVTFKSKGVPGIVIILRSTKREFQRVFHTTTDKDGNYRFTRVPPGSYTVRRDAPAFVEVSDSRDLIIDEDEVAENVNFE